MILSKTMLENRNLKRICESREKQTFQDFYCWTKEGDWTVGIGVLRIFTRFKEWDNDRSFPNVRYDA